MERSSIDLNQHAFDLNEVPSTDHSSTFPGSSSHNGSEKLWLPKKGGWLELFCKMFGHETLVMNHPSSMVYNNGRLRIESDSQWEGVNLNGNFSVLHSASMTCNGQRLQDSRHDHKSKVNFSANDNALHDDFMTFKGQNLETESKIHQNQGKRKPSRKKSDTKQLFSHRLEVPGMLQLPCLPMTENVDPDFQACNSNTRNRNLFDEFPRGGRSGLMNCHEKLFPTDPEQVNSSLDSTKALLKDCLKHEFPTWDLNYIPSPVLNVDFQSLPQASPKSANIRQQSMLSSANLMQKTPARTPPVSVIKTKQKCSCALPLSNTFEMIPCSQMTQCGVDTEMRSLSISRQAYGIPKKIDELSAQNNHKCAAEGSKVYGIGPCEDMQPSSSSPDRVKSQASRVKIVASPDWLPEGWITELKRRQGGSTAGTTDKYYKDPITGRRFRSKNEVLNYLQTGVACRNKSLSKPLDRSTTSTLPKEHHFNGLQPSAADHSRPSPKTDAVPIDLNHQCMKLKGPVSDRISIIKRQGEDMVAGSCAVKPAKNSASDVWRKGGYVWSIKESLVPCSKRKMDHDSYKIASTAKRQCSADKEEEEDEEHEEEEEEEIDNLKQVCSVPSPVQKLGGTKSHGMDNINTRVSHPTYGELPAILEAKSFQDRQITQPLLLSWTLPPFCTANPISNTIEYNSDCHTGAAHHQKGLVNIILEKKNPKLTLKQERDLFISLGRKLCREFISSANGTLGATD